jgi:RNA-binding protein
MEMVNSFQAKYLRGLAHKLKPIVFIGQKGLTPTVIQSTKEALDRHELIKIKFLEFKEKQQKKEISAAIEAQSGCRMVGLIGHIATFYRLHSDPEKRKIRLPESK